MIKKISLFVLLFLFVFPIGNLNAENTNTEPLSISNIEVTNVTKDSAKISWTTNIESNTWVTYGSTDNENRVKEEDNYSSVTEHVAFLNYLSPGTTYHFEVSSREEGVEGSTAVSATGEFTTLEDENLPDFIVKDIKIKQIESENYIYVDIENIGGPAKPAYQILNILITDRDTGDVYTGAITDDYVSGYTAEISSAYPLKEKNSNIYNLNATVNKGSSSYSELEEESKTNNILLKEINIENINTEPLLISNIEVTNITKDSATISWESNRMVNNIYYYRKQGDSNWKKAGGMHQTSIHSAVMYNLIPGTTYEYYIDVEDGLGNDFKSEIYTFSTSEVSFVEKPDLVVRSVHLPSAEDKRFVVEVRNQGNTATSFSDGIKVSASVRNSDNSLVALSSSYNYIDNLEPDKFGSATFYITGDISEEIELKIWIDNADNGDGGFIDESNENNNIFTKTIKMNQGNNENEDNSDNNNDSDDDNNNTNHLVLQLKRKITALEKQVISLEKKLTILDQKFANKYSGTMFLDVENHGRLWYVDPASKNRFYFENGASALSIGSKLATGITYEDIKKIPVGVPDKLYNLKDSDGDGLPDRLESALGSDPNENDTDNDGYSDKEELENGYNPINNNKYNYDQSLAEKLEGKMLLQVSGPNSHGEIWYVKDGKRWYGGTEDSMYEIMKARSLGAISENIRKIEVGGVMEIE